MEEIDENEWHHGHTIGWYASDLYRLGYIKTLEEWEEFIDVVNDNSMKFFQDKEGESDERNH